MNEIELVVLGKEKDLGGFSVHRVLPYATHRMVGPFIFFDHMGPAEFPPARGMDVRPHPHIGLATVTYLFKGKIRHRDNIGSDQLIEPGAINWMTAGKGIVHSERMPEDLRASGGPMHGIQCWVALPEAAEDSAPSFHHHPAATLPEFTRGRSKLKLLVGRAYGFESPVKVHSEIFYLDVELPAEETLSFQAEGREAALYVVEGEISIGQEKFERYSMAILRSGEDLQVRATRDARVMLFGGAPLGPRFIYWNFVSSSKEKLEQAKQDWRQGPSAGRFQPIPGDGQEYIPLPSEPGNPKGTVM